jgi:hypothetical protein
LTSEHKQLQTASNGFKQLPGLCANDTKRKPGGVRILRSIDFGATIRRGSLFLSRLKKLLLPPFNQHVLGSPNLPGFS